MSDPLVSPQPTLRRWVPIVGILAGLCLVGVIVALPTLLKMIPTPNLAALLEPEEPQQPPTRLPAVFQRQPLVYGEAEPKTPVTPAAPTHPVEQPPIATLISKTPAATPVETAQTQVASVLGSLNPFGTLNTGNTTTQQTPTKAEATATTSTTPAKTDKPKTNTKWVLVPTDMNLAPANAGQLGKADTDMRDEQGTPIAKKLAREGQASQLIKSATWARPSRPDLTLYMSQVLAGRTTEAINSDLPGTTIVELTVPVFDKVGAGQEILPKGALVVTKQVGKAEYGQKRLDVTIQQIEFPGKLGVVWSVKGDVGDEKGARGVTGPVNNHVFSLLGAVAINAVLSLGTNAIAGTPTGFYQNPAQQAARETSQSASGDIRKITDAQLKVPPTIEPPKGTICTIHLSENVTFSKNPTLVR